jgi:hypothetical protein
MGERAKHQNMGHLLSAQRGVQGEFGEEGERRINLKTK